MFSAINFNRNNIGDAARVTLKKNSYIDPTDGFSHPCSTYDGVFLAIKLNNYNVISGF